MSVARLPAPSVTRLRVCSDASAAPEPRWTISIGWSSDDARRDVEHEAVGEERGVERGEGLVARRHRRVERACDQLGPLGDRRRGRAEPDAGRQRADRRQFRRKPAVDQHEAMRRAGKPISAQRRRHARRRCARAGRQQRLLFAAAADRDSASSRSRRRRKAQLGEAARAPRSRASRARARPGSLAARACAKRVEIGRAPRASPGNRRSALIAVRPRSRRVADRAVAALLELGGEALVAGLRRCGRPAAHAPGRARRSRAAAGNG